MAYHVRLRPAREEKKTRSVSSLLLLFCPLNFHSNSGALYYYDDYYDDYYYDYYYVARFPFCYVSLSPLPPVLTPSLAVD